VPRPRALLAATIILLTFALRTTGVDAALVPGQGGFGGPGADPGAFIQPGGVAFTSSGQLWVADTGNARLERLTRTGALAQVVTGFTTPAAVAVGPDDSVYVADQAAGRVVKLFPDGTIDPGFRQDGIQDARAVAVDPRGDFIYVTGGSTGRLDQLSAATGTATRLVASGLATPTGVAVDADGTIAVAEQGADRILVLDADDGSASRFGVRGADAGSFDRPTGVAFDPYGVIVVADTGNGRIQRFTPSGSLVDSLGGFGSPVAVASDEIQTFAVVDSGGSRIAFADDVLPPPSLGQTANVARLEGTVTIRGGGAAPRPLLAPEQIRFGTEIDTTRGTLRLVTARTGGGTQRATLYQGRFTLRQPASNVPTATLTGNQLNSCPASTTRGSTARLPDPDPPPGKPKRSVRTRVKGEFKTNGNSASASVKGTDYEVADYCSGTLVTVYSGVVLVTRRSDGASTLLRGTLARPGSLFVKAPVKRKKTSAQKRR
jgi:sugar lactone lactonase YvrE